MNVDKCSRIFSSSHTTLPSSLLPAPFLLFHSFHSTNCLPGVNSELIANTEAPRYNIRVIPRRVVGSGGDTHSGLRLHSTFDLINHYSATPAAADDNKNKRTSVSTEIPNAQASRKERKAEGRRDLPEIIDRNT